VTAAPAGPGGSPARRLLGRIAAAGWRGAVVPVCRLADLDDAIRERWERGEIDDALYHAALAALARGAAAAWPRARSVVVVAVPTPPVRLVFRWRGRNVPVTVPPTYVGYTARTTTTQDALAAWLREDGWALARPSLALKTLAVRSGLAAYGRNNVTYVPEMGSFLQLVGGVTDLPCDGDPWREPVALDRCASCVACARRCPTGAIADDRFLIRAERCLTYHNEATADFPGWIDPSWHHCLVGCMRCQTACPANRAFRDWHEDRGAFDEDETAALLGRVRLEELPPATAAKLRGLELNEDYGALCRNLGALLYRDSAV